jgi:hypothetical protein
MVGAITRVPAMVSSCELRPGRVSGLVEGLRWDKPMDGRGLEYCVSCREG